MIKGRIERFIKGVVFGHSIEAGLASGPGWVEDVFDEGVVQDVVEGDLFLMVEDFFTYVSSRDSWD